MRYLCRLVTPKGGTVLVPFMGSGSTGVSSKLTGRGFIGIELDKDYFNIAKDRIDDVPENTFEPIVKPNEHQLTTQIHPDMKTLPKKKA